MTSRVPVHVISQRLIRKLAKKTTTKKTFPPFWDRFWFIQDRLLQAVFMLTGPRTLHWRTLSDEGKHSQTLAHLLNCNTKKLRPVSRKLWFSCYTVDVVSVVRQRRISNLEEMTCLHSYRDDTVYLCITVNPTQLNLIYSPQLAKVLSGLAKTYPLSAHSLNTHLQENRGELLVATFFTENFLLWL